MGQPPQPLSVAEGVGIRLIVGWHGATPSLAVDHLCWFAAEAGYAYDRVVPKEVAGKRHLVVRIPEGVAAAIAPWNFPLMLALRSALPRGNSAIIATHRGGGTAIHGFLGKLGNRRGCPDIDGCVKFSGDSADL